MPDTVNCSTTTTTTATATKWANKSSLIRIKSKCQMTVSKIPKYERGSVCAAYMRGNIYLSWFFIESNHNLCTILK